jgi:diguanylate cyclase (GGDEF)-like protein
MRIDWKSLQPEWAARSFALTMISLLVPGVILAALSIDRFSHILTQNALIETERRASDVANATSVRVLAADDRLQLIDGNLAALDSATANVEELANPYFRTVARLDAAGRLIQVAGPAPTQITLKESVLRQLATDAAAVLIATSVGGQPGVFLIRKTSKPLAGGLLIGELNPGYLWGQPHADAHVRGVCVLDQAMKSIFCPRALPDSTLNHLKAASGGSDSALEWNDGDGRWLGSYAKFNLASVQLPQDWTIVASQVRSPMNDAYAVLGPGLGVFLAISLLLSAAFARARNRAASRARAHEPSGASSPKPHPAQLPDIHARFDRQARAMAALSEIDRALLSRASMDRVFESLLRNSPQAISADFFAVVLIDRDAPTRSRTLLIRSAQPENQIAERTSIDPSTIRLLTSQPDGFWVADAASHPFLAPLAVRGARRFFLVPAFWDGIPSAIFALGFTDREALSDEERAYARDFADRVGVALTTWTLDEELRRLGQYDSTTLLPNRRTFKDRMTQEMARARRERHPIALLFIDLDEFKKVNDSAGHSSGDAVLEQASRRLKRCLREEDIVARFGGDEFAILLPAIAKGTDAAVVAEKIINQLSRPYNLDGQDHFLSASVGICVFPDDAQSIDLLLRYADLAMYRAKGEGGGRYAFFEERMNAQVIDRAVLETDLRNALMNNELTLFFQPQVDLRTGQISGAEALVRWTHSKRGFVLPGAFIGVSEQSGLIDKIGEFVRKSACSHYGAWELAGIAPPRIAVNVSSRELKRTDFTKNFESVLRDSGVRPYSLEVEITESLFVDSSEQVVTAIKWMHDRGIRIAIDDFGTGYSSISYLKRLPFDIIKLDRAFVKDIGQSAASDAIAVAILGMARNLGKEVIAEGVETVEQRDFLIRHGCETAQGYLWSKPLPACEFESMARAWNATEDARRLPFAAEFAES